MIDVSVKIDLNGIKQLLIYGVVFSVVLSMAGGLLLPRMPTSGDIGTYITWLITFIIASLALGAVSIILFMFSKTAVGKLR